MNHKRIIVLLLALVLVLQLFPLSAHAEQRRSFADTHNHWVAGFLNSLADREVEIFRGIQQDGRYYLRPNQHITRAEFAAVLVRVFDLYDPTAPNPFLDVYGGAWYATYLASAAEAEIVHGANAAGTIFNPRALLTRQEAMVMIARICLELPYFDDIDEDEWEEILDRFLDVDAKDAWASEGAVFVVYHQIIRGIAQGDGAYFLQPHGRTTRAEVVAMIEGMLNRIHIERVFNQDREYDVVYPEMPQTPPYPQQPPPPPPPPTPTPPPPIPDVNRNDLWAAYQSAGGDVDLAFTFTPGSFGAFLTAYNDVFRVLSNAWSTQEEIDAAYDALDAARANLVPLPPADYLREAIIMGEVSEQLPDRFTPASHANMMNALNTARAAANGGSDAAQSAAARNLMNAIRALQPV
ncbi:MAG: S-layer homology domain-containing protein [Oscillospiraceae bacterium]|nr:S-layer homology domain-containing protein [Oscillospiraceae bacterium]